MGGGATVDGRETESVSENAAAKTNSRRHWSRHIASSYRARRNNNQPERPRSRLCSAAMRCRLRCQHFLKLRPSSPTLQSTTIALNTALGFESSGCIPSMQGRYYRAHHLDLSAQTSINLAPGWKGRHLHHHCRAIPPGVAARPS